MHGSIVARWQGYQSIAVALMLRCIEVASHYPQIDRLNNMCNRAVWLACNFCS